MQTIKKTTRDTLATAKLLWSPASVEIVARRSGLWKQVALAWRDLILRVQPGKHTLPEAMRAMDSSNIGNAVSRP